MTTDQAASRVRASWFMGNEPFHPQSRTRQLPYIIVALLVFVLFCSSSSVIVLVVSSNDEVDKWKNHLQPAVYLAGLSALFNTSLGILLSIGTTITWWRSAQHGATLARLQRIWESGVPRGIRISWIYKALISKVGLAAVIVAIAEFANNPLLQHATTVISYEQFQNVSATMGLARTIPDEWYGLANYSNWFVGGNANDNHLHVQQECIKNVTLTTGYPDGFFCNGICEGSLPGAGFTFSCNTPSMSNFSIIDKANQGPSGFELSFNRSVDTAKKLASIEVTASFISDVSDTCVAMVSTQTCSLQIATVLYNFEIQNATIFLSHDKPRQVVGQVNTSTADLATEGYGPAGPLWGLMNHASVEFGDKATISLVGSSYVFRPEKTLSNLFFVANRTAYPNPNDTKCMLKWSDPMPYVLRHMDEFMFRSSRFASTFASLGDANQTFVVEQRNSMMKFHTSALFTGLGIAAQLLGLLAVSVLLYGFWELERDVTLSPLEIAYAFRSPIFTDARENLTLDAIREKVGGTKVVADKGFVFGENDSEQSNRYSRLSVMEVGAELTSPENKTGASTAAAEEGTYSN